MIFSINNWALLYINFYWHRFYIPRRKTRVLWYDMELLVQPLVAQAKCDLCHRTTACSYVEQLDEWLCFVCLDTMLYLLEKFSNNPHRLVFETTSATRGSAHHLPEAKGEKRSIRTSGNRLHRRNNDASIQA